ncbi:MAG: killer suppression protein [Chloroflexi bacterium]|nr:MAG: killer suppression protein [Chloroflexota bacterium]
MDITFNSTKLQKVCNSANALRKKYGVKKAKKIQQRLIDLHAAETLEVITHLPPPRCHELKGNHKGKFTVDTDYPYRILFEPANEPLPLLADGGIDKTKVTAICILDVNIDTHE